MASPPPRGTAASGGRDKGAWRGALATAGWGTGPGGTSQRGWSDQGARRPRSLPSKSLDGRAAPGLAPHAPAAPHLTPREPRSSTQPEPSRPLRSEPCFSPASAGSAGCGGELRLTPRPAEHCTSLPMVQAPPLCLRSLRLADADGLPEGVGGVQAGPERQAAGRLRAGIAPRGNGCLGAARGLSGRLPRDPSWPASGSEAPLVPGPVPSTAIRRPLACGCLV